MNSNKAFKAFMQGNLPERVNYLVYLFGADLERMLNTVPKEEYILRCIIAEVERYLAHDMSIEPVTLEHWRRLNDNWLETIKNISNG